MAGQLSGTAVLVADDDVESLDAIEDVIAEQGATVRSAKNAREALEVLRTWRPDILVLDIAMPEMDGYDLLATIRREPSLRAIPAIAVTGHGYARDKRRAEDVGFAKHITKPVDIDTLVDIIAELVPALG
jgi:two-component system, chemotaxis family, CheB/CheR fusion protein